MTRRRFALTTLALLVAAGPAAAQTPAPASRTLILSSRRAAGLGLLDVLVPMFEQASGYSVKTISVGTGQALALAARGEADVTLAHAPALEKKYVEEGKMLNRRLVMYNDFVVIGARIGAGQGTAAAEAFRGSPPRRRARVARRQVRYTCSSRHSGNRRGSSGRPPGTSSGGRAWARPWASPMTAVPTR